MPKFFSVIICSFNRASLLPRALDSLLAQSEGDWEAVVIDDGSSDGTGEVVRRYSSFSGNIRLFQRACNRGVGAARNIGIAISSGRFVTFLDSDDEYAVDHLATRKQLLRSNPLLRVVHGGMKIVGDPYVPDKEEPTRRIHLNQCAVGGTFFIRRDVFAEVGGFDDLGYAEDARFLENTIASKIEVHRTDHPSYIYYRNIHGQITENSSTNPPAFTPNQPNNVNHSSV